MARIAALLLATVMVAACAPAAPGPSATPATPSPIPTAAPTAIAAAPTSTARPSPGCGFELHITNETQSLVLVDVNHQRVGTIEAQASLRLYEGDPPMPWDVVVSRASDGVQLASQHYEDTDETEELTVTDANVGFGPTGCG